MEKILGESSALSPTLLLEDEEQYESLAVNLVTKLSKIPFQDAVALQALDVRMHDPRLVDRIADIN
jgi:hypothetical protein